MKEKKMPFNEIETSQELLTRVEDGVLSVGGRLKRIRFLLNMTRTKDEDVEVLVKYNTPYGKGERKYFVVV